MAKIIKDAVNVVDASGQVIRTYTPDMSNDEASHLEMAKEFASKVEGRRVVAGDVSAHVEAPAAPVSAPADETAPAAPSEPVSEKPAKPVKPAKPKKTAKPVSVPA